jgi:hypothetical protein
MGGRFVGEIFSVTEQPLHNRWTREITREHVIVFLDCEYKLVLGDRIREQLCERFGDESDDWIGKVIAIGSQFERYKHREGGQWNRVLLPESDLSWLAEDAFGTP